MIYKCFDEGKITQEGEMDKISDPDVPTHGSISFLLPNGQWLSLLTSEWLHVRLDTKPVTWETIFE